MHLEPLITLNCAWQLHYYLCFRARSSRQLFSAHEDTLLKTLNEICQRHDYHVLQAKAYPEHLR